MPEFKITKVQIDKVPNFTDPELLAAERAKGIGYRYGLLGRVELTRSDSAEAFEIPILVDLEWNRFASVKSNKGTPIVILLSLFAYNCLSKTSALSFVIWHECGHIVDGTYEHEPGDRNYSNEHSADVYAAEHVGYEDAFKSLRYINFLLKDEVSEDALQELAFRASDLGDEAATRFIEEKGWKRN